MAGAVIWALGLCVWFASISDAAPLKPVIPAQLEDSTACKYVGIDSREFQHSLHVEEGYFLPYYSDVGRVDIFEREWAHIEYAVIAIHGVTGAANRYFCAAKAVLPEPVAILVPWFGNETIHRGDWSTPGKGWVHNKTEQNVIWRGSRWIGGAPDRSGQYSSFNVLENTFLPHLFSAVAFPNLKMVTICGFSAGGQFAQRYAWYTRFGTSAEPERVPLRFLVSDPGSYLYLDHRRPVASCTPLRDTGPDWRCAKFDEPPEAVMDICGNYDSWKYGVHDYCSNYMVRSPGDCKGLNPLAQYELKLERMRAYRHKEIHYVFGSRDSCNCNIRRFKNPDHCLHPTLDCQPTDQDQCCDTYPDSPINWLNVRCEAMLQGSNRLQRGLLYMDYLRDFFGEEYAPNFTVLDIGHNGTAMLESDEVVGYVTNWDPIIQGARRAGTGSGSAGAVAGSAGGVGEAAGRVWRRAADAVSDWAIAWQQRR